MSSTAVPTPSIISTSTGVPSTSTITVPFIPSPVSVSFTVTSIVTLP